MKTIAFTALHYGSEYLAWAIRSVIDHVDEYWVLYASKGSHGHHTDARCPDSRALLLSIASEAAGPKLRWVDGEWAHEGYQRDAIHQHAPDADVILVLDADEIWPEALVGAVLQYARSIQYDWPRRMFRLPMIHYWRSFYRAVINDKSYPVRVIFPRIPAGETAAFTHVTPISHFGYAQRPVTVGYKQYVHGHKNEWRTDLDWFRDRYLANAQADCHPVTVDYWTPEPVEPLDYMPSWMAEHPYFGQEVIK